MVRSSSAFLVATDVIDEHQMAPHEIIEIPKNQSYLVIRFWLLKCEKTVYSVNFYDSTVILFHKLVYCKLYSSKLFSGRMICSRRSFAHWELFGEKLPLRFKLTCNKMKDHNYFGIDVWVASERENDLISESKPGHNQPEHHHAPTLKIISWKNSRTNRKSPF